MDDVEKKKSINIRETSGIIMAYLGDSVWELVVRKHFIEKGWNILNLNKKVKSFVNAKKQSKIYKEIFSTLEEEYQNVGRRARNANIKSFPKSCDKIEYREATAFEAIIGALYLNDKKHVIEKIIEKWAEEENNGL